MKWILDIIKKYRGRKEYKDGKPNNELNTTIKTSTDTYDVCNQ